MPPRRGRGAPKEPLILDAAREVFLRRGYGPAGVDEIAALAGVSKVTLYRYFPGKQQLFAAVIRRAVEQAEPLPDDRLESVARTGDLEADLTAFARRFVTTATDPALLRMRRLVVAEAERLPELARTWDELGRQQGQRRLRRLFDALAGRGLLRGDMELAAEQFLWLLLGAPLHEFLYESTARYPTRDPDAHAAAAVRTFLAAFGVADRAQPGADDQPTADHPDGP